MNSQMNTGNGQGLLSCRNVPSWYPSQMLGIHGLHRRTILQSVTEFPVSKRQDMMFVVAHVKRSSSLEPWGMAFSMFDDRVVFGKVKENGKQVMKWCHSIRACEQRLDPRIVFSPKFKSFDSPEVYNQQLQAYAGAMATTNELHQQLWPGDLLVSIDGYDPADFQTLIAFTNYLRSINQFTLIVLRHPHAATSAMAHWDARRYSGMPPPPDAAFRAATAADACWQQILSTVGVQITFPHTVHTKIAVTRQVTPDQSISSLNGTENNSESFGVPRSLFGTNPNVLDRTQFANPLELLSRVAESSTASSTSFYAARQASLAYLNQPQTIPKHIAKVSSKPPQKLQIPSNWRNPWFQDENGIHLPFDDNLEFSPEDGERAHLFLKSIDNFPTWLQERKQHWKRKYKVYSVESEVDVEEKELEKLTVAHDFWTQQGFRSFDEWMVASLTKWKLSYSWNKKTTQRIQKECEAIVHICQEPRKFRHWLHIRRNQWRLSRRKRQRERIETIGTPGCCVTDGASPGCESALERRQGDVEDILGSRKRRKVLTPEITDLAAIDVILELEDHERKRRESEKQRLIDISFLFDASLGAPDDVVVHCLLFLGRDEYGKLLCINKVYATALKAREEVWKRLCPSHWILPRRPRKPWHELYFHRLRIEQRDSQKLWDDLLIKCSSVLLKGDHVQTIEKLVQQGEKDFGFTVNYVSSIVCERNSILNLAVIHQRHKVVRWLVDHKNADIESYDRGHFTALLNAAWAGDRQLVRFLLQRGANRTKIGYGHYSKALAHPDFKGLTAEGWARKRGHDDIADLIRLGL